jgi:hypothetical protein
MLIFQKFNLAKNTGFFVEQQTAVFVPQNFPIYQLETTDKK